MQYNASNMLDIAKYIFLPFLS